jgi:hypothetical protein
MTSEIFSTAAVSAFETFWVIVSEARTSVIVSGVSAPLVSFEAGASIVWPLSGTGALTGRRLVVRFLAGAPWADRLAPVLGAFAFDFRAFFFAEAFLVELSFADRADRLAFRPSALAFAFRAAFVAGAFLVAFFFSRFFAMARPFDSVRIVYWPGMLCHLVFTLSHHLRPGSPADRLHFLSRRSMTCDRIMGEIFLTNWPMSHGSWTCTCT